MTILSRCQRFDLRRVDSATLQTHFASILDREDAKAEPEALALIARAADGSVRDGLSLLDQAISRAEEGLITAEKIRVMFGLADRIVIFDLMEFLLKGEAKSALDLLETLHQAGGDPVTITQDLLELTHHLTRLKLVPGSQDDVTVPEAERVRGSALANSLSMPALTRAWNVLLKGLGEIQIAPHPRQALEMVILRLIYTADLPTPGELIKQLRDNNTMPAGIGGSPKARSAVSGGGPSGAMAQGLPQADFRAAENPEAKHPIPISFRAVVDLFSAEQEAVIAGHLFSAVHLTRFEPGVIEFFPEPSAPPNLAALVAKKLSEWTGQRWVVGISNAPGAPTLAAEERQNRNQALTAAADHPTVKALLEAFPGARLTGIRTIAPAVTEPLEDPSSEELWLEE